MNEEFHLTGNFTKDKVAIMRKDGLLNTPLINLYLGCIRMKSHMRRHTHLVAAAVGVLSIMFLNGCASKHSQQLEVIRQGGKFYKPYLEGDVEQARQNLEQANQFFQSQRAEILGPSGRACYIFSTYARLYALEKRVGNENAAEAALIKARFWHLQNYEQDESWKIRVTREKFISLNTPEKIMELADKLDKGATGGRGPKYIQYIEKR